MEPQARAPACQRCGAPLPLDLLNPSVRCRHCGADVAVDEALRARMRSYVGDAARAIREEMQARWVGAFYAQNELAANKVVLGTVGVAVAGTGLLLGLILGVDGIPLAFFLLLAVSWLGSIWAFARGWAVMYAIPTPAQLASVRIARCESCGAASNFGAAEAAVRCKHCGSTLVVPSELAASLLREAKQQAAQASTAEGEAFERATVAGNRLINPSLVFIFVVVPAAVLAVIFGGHRAGPDLPAWMLMLLGGASLAAAVRSMVRATVASMEARRSWQASADRLSASLAPAQRSLSAGIFQSP